ncbi:TIGR03364 family FAD-dependent oxidoreductase [Paenarthrobacter nitroguajacolicus]|uniref:TIGR03364 family FAD-dependent oxidoreductase n=1 Tax=Paenarthrobacter nitroguajacolicus TaxID=211146 RepID=UPI004053F7ED
MIPLTGAAIVGGVNNPSTSPQAANSSPRQPTDVVIIGAGIVGLAHAAHAVANGLTVTIIERDHHAVGASVRNFGHCCITAQSGELYELAQTSRKYWLEFAERAGFWASEAGAVVLARTEAEMNVLRELAEVREPGQVELLSPARTRARLGAAVSTPGETHDDDSHQGGWPGLVGGAFLRDDLRVDPRTTVAKLAEWLSEQPGVELHWNTAALGFSRNPEGVTVLTSRGELTARQVFVCVGHDVDYLFPDLAREHRIKRCALQMSLAAKPSGVEFAPAVLTATSMLRYPAFTDMPTAAALHSEVLENQPKLLEIGANVMFTQRPDGTIILGDSHHYHHTADPFLDETVTATLNTEIAGRIGEPLEIIQRWQGIYASSDVTPILVREVQPGVTVVSVTSGVGMTLSFGLAHRNVSHLY